MKLRAWATINDEIPNETRPLANMGLVAGTLVVPQSTSHFDFGNNGHKYDVEVQDNGNTENGNDGGGHDNGNNDQGVYDGGGQDNGNILGYDGEDNGNVKAGPADARPDLRQINISRSLKGPAIGRSGGGLVIVFYGARRRCRHIHQILHLKS
jgi:hypothetical protein